jgi:hypothetical protein
VKLAVPKGRSIPSKPDNPSAADPYAAWTEYFKQYPEYYEAMMKAYSNPATLAAYYNQYYGSSHPGGAPASGVGPEAGGYDPSQYAALMAAMTGNIATEREQSASSSADKIPPGGDSYRPLESRGDRPYGYPRRSTRSKSRSRSRSRSPRSHSRSPSRERFNGRRRTREHDRGRDNGRDHRRYSNNELQDSGVNHEQAARYYPASPRYAPYPGESYRPMENFPNHEPLGLQNPDIRPYHPSEHAPDRRRGH